MERKILIDGNLDVSKLNIDQLLLARQERLEHKGFPLASLIPGRNASGDELSAIERNLIEEHGIDVAFTQIGDRIPKALIDKGIEIGQGGIIRQVVGAGMFKLGEFIARR